MDTFYLKLVYYTLLRAFYYLEYLLELLSYRLLGLGDLEEELIIGRVAIVTGANSGIGKEVTKELADRGATVILACRNVEAGKKAVSDIKGEVQNASLVLMELDLSDLNSVRKFASEVKARYPAVHLLVNNAGVCLYQKSLQKTKEGFELHMGVNHLGHFLLTNLLQNNLVAGAPSRVVVLSSGTLLNSNLRLNDLMMENVKQPCVWTGISRMPYNNSKMANALFAKELGRRLDGTGVTVYSLCPGIVRTEVFRDTQDFDKIATSAIVAIGGITTKQAVEGVLYCAISRKCEHETGKYYRFGQVHRRGNRMLKTKDAEELWGISEKLVNSH